MADITDPSVGLDQPSPGDDLAGNGGDARGTKRPRASMAGDDDDDDDEKGGRERRKIEIKVIQDKSRRRLTFSKRKAGIMKKVGPSVRPRAKTQAHTCYRHTNCRCSLVLKSCFWSSPRLVSSTHSPRPNFNRSSLRLRART